MACISFYLMRWCSTIKYEKALFNIWNKTKQSTIWLNCPDPKWPKKKRRNKSIFGIGLIEWRNFLKNITTAWNTPETFQKHGFLSNHWNCWQHSLQFHREQIPLMLRDYMIKFVKCITQSLTQLTRDENQTKRIECIVNQWQ